MRRRTVPVSHVRAALRARFAAQVATYTGRTPIGGGRPSATNGHAPGVVAALDAGDPVVLASWELSGLGLPQVRPGVHAWFRVDPDGTVVEVGSPALAVDDEGR